MTVIINWYKGKNVADNGTYLSSSLIELRSQIHGEDLSQYEIYRAPAEVPPEEGELSRGLHRTVARGQASAREGSVPLAKQVAAAAARETAHGRRRFVALAAGAISPEVQSAAILIGSRKEERRPRPTSMPRYGRMGAGCASPRWSVVAMSATWNGLSPRQ